MRSGSLRRNAAFAIVATVLGTCITELAVYAILFPIAPNLPVPARLTSGSATLVVQGLGCAIAALLHRIHATSARHAHLKTWFTACAFLAWACVHAFSYMDSLGLRCAGPLPHALFGLGCILFVGVGARAIIAGIHPRQARPSWHITAVLVACAGGLLWCNTILALLPSKADARLYIACAVFLQAAILGGLGAFQPAAPAPRRLPVALSVFAIITLVGGSLAFHRSAVSVLALRSTYFAALARNTPTLGSRSSEISTQVFGQRLRAPDAAPLASAERQDPARVRGVVLIVVDTLRADYVNSDAPSFAAATPHIRAIAHTGQTFTTTLTPGANTSIALPAMFTSRNATDLDFRVPTLAERFADAGWETAAVTSDFFVTREDPNVRRTLDGFTRVHVYDRAKQSELVPMVRRTLDEVGDQPFFAWVHVDAPHFPGWCGQPGSGRHFAWPLEYVRGVEWADAQVGLIAEELTRRRLDNDVVLIVVGDHGEGLRDLRTPWHGLMAAPAIAEVPFIVRIPGVPGRSRPETVGSIDLAPTIAALAALRPSPYDLGQDLTGPTRSRGYLTSALDQGAQLAYTDGATRIIYDFDLELAVDLSRKGDAGSMNGLAALELAVPQTFLDHGVRTKDIRNAQRAVLNLPHRHSALSTELARPVLRTLSHRERTRAYRDWLAASPSWDATTAILAEWALVDAKTSTHECTRLFQGASEREQSAFAVALTHRGLGCLAPSALTKFLRDCLDAPDAPLACSAGIGLARHIETAPEVLLTAIEQLSTLDATTPHHGAMLAQALEAASITRSTGALASAMRDRALHLIRDRRTGVRAGAFRALRNVGTWPEDASSMERGMRDGAFAVRQAAFESALSLGGSAAVPTVKRLISLPHVLDTAEYMVDHHIDGSEGLLESAANAMYACETRE